MKKYKHLFILLAIFLFTAVFGPLLINFLYSFEEPLIITKWTASEALLYYGAIIGGMATLATIYVAFYNSESTIMTLKKEKEYRKNYDDYRLRITYIQANLAKTFQTLNLNHIFRLFDITKIDETMSSRNIFTYEVKSLTRFGTLFNENEVYIIKSEIKKIENYANDFSESLRLMTDALSNYHKNAYELKIMRMEQNWYSTKPLDESIEEAEKLRLAKENWFTIQRQELLKLDAKKDTVIPLVYEIENKLKKYYEESLLKTTD